MQSCFFVFRYLFAQNKQKGNQTLETLLPTIHSTYHDHLKIYCFLSSLPSYTRDRGKKIVVGTVVKSNIGELEEEIRASSLRRTRKYLTCVVQEV